MLIAASGFLGLGSVLVDQSGRCTGTVDLRSGDGKARACNAVTDRRAIVWMPEPHDDDAIRVQIVAQGTRRKPGAHRAAGRVGNARVHSDT